MDAEAAHISATGRVTYLADHAIASGMLPSFMDDLMVSYREQLGDPLKWTIKSFHDSTGAVIANTASTANPQVLKPMGDIDNNTANTNRRAANIASVSVSIQVDLSPVTGEQANKVELNTVMKLSMENKTVRDGAGNTITVHTFQGNDDIQTYTVEEWAAIRARTGQPLKGCSLKPAPFGQTHAVLEHATAELPGFMHDPAAAKGRPASNMPAPPTRLWHLRCCRGGNMAY